ncbi:hypothetical protein MMC25_001238 [Agyrium rufum]|nr:hypothetical protein [Agyrium rufum]
MSDYYFEKLSRKHGGSHKPEFRVPLMIPSAIFVPAGLFWYGWSAQANLHWIIPSIGTLLFGIGSQAGVQFLSSYIIDAYPLYAASATGTVWTTSSLAAFALPLLAPALYDKLHYGWGNSVLAIAVIVIGWPAPWLLWTYGER